jgi:hypothetical protein
VFITSMDAPWPKTKRRAWRSRMPRMSRGSSETYPPCVGAMETAGPWGGYTALSSALPPMPVLSVTTYRPSAKTAWATVADAMWACRTIRRGKSIRLARVSVRSALSVRK